MNADMEDSPEVEIEINAEGVIEEAPKETPEEKTDDKSNVLNQDEKTENTENLIDLTELGIEVAEKPEDDDSDKIDPLADPKEKKSPSSEEITEPGDKKPKSDSEQPSLFNSFASILADEGVLLTDEVEKITDAKTFLEAIKTTVKQNEFSDLNDKQKKALEAFRAGVPVEEYVESANQMEILDSIKEEHINGETEESLKLRKDLIVENMMRKGFTETKAERYAEMHVDAGSDKEEALDAHTSLKAIANIDIEKRLADKAEKERKAAEKKAAFQEELKKSVETVDIIPGMKLNSSLRGKVYESMTTPAVTTKDGRAYDAVMTNWTKDQSYKMKVHALHVITKGFTDFTPLYGGKQKSQSAIDRLDQLASEGNILVRGNTASNRPKENLGKVKSFLDSLPDPSNY